MSTTTNSNMAALIANIGQGRAIIAGLATATLPKLTVKARSDKTPAREVFPGELVKITQTGVFLNLSYAGIVNSRRDKEGKTADFEAEARQWGSYIDGSRVVVENNGKLYLAAYFVCAAKPKVAYYTVTPGDGEPVRNVWTRFDVTPQIKADFFPVEREEGARQGLDTPVVYRNYALSSVVALAYRGERHVNTEAAFVPPTCLLDQPWQDAVAEAKREALAWLERLAAATVATTPDDDPVGNVYELGDELREALAHS